MTNAELQNIVCLLLDNNYKQYFKIPPILKNEANLTQFVKFFFIYYSGKKQVTLKNAPQYITFTKISISKTHVWMQIIGYAVRLIFVRNFGNVEKVHAFFEKYLPDCPLMVKSAASKYKYITLNHWSKDHFLQVCQNDLQYLNNPKSSYGYLPKNLAKEQLQEKIIISLEDLIQVSEKLDAKGSFDLSEKILNSAENIAANLRHIKHENS
jgi:hypothetical protein